MIPFTMLAIVIISVTVPTVHTTLIRKGAVATAIGSVGFFLYYIWFGTEGTLGGQEHYPSWPFWWWAGLTVVGVITMLVGLIGK
ncbi:MAG TPA: hypothetical protein VE400_04545 [Mycobacterium sp.]|jgi:lipopolysaccharide export LptBFGC system permease protein LptF|nr:hypothetical protein [Mycobacterium sp.]